MTADNSTHHLTCRKCKRAQHAKHFPFLGDPFNFLTRFKRETCQDCWRGQPFANVLRHQSSKWEWKQQRATKRKATAERHYAEKRVQGNARSSARRCAELQATPTWADRRTIDAFYKEALDLTLETGIAHHVDHIVPLQSAIVCGLNVPWNLQILTSQANIAKSNRFFPGRDG